MLGSRQIDGKTTSAAPMELFNPVSQKIDSLADGISHK
jgi:hypothetical protein